MLAWVGIVLGALLITSFVVASICYINNVRNHVNKTSKKIRSDVIIAVGIGVFVISLLVADWIIRPDFDGFNNAPSSEDRISEETYDYTSVATICFVGGTDYSESVSSGRSLVTLSPQNEYVVTAKYNARMYSAISTYYIPKDEVLDIIPTQKTENPTLKVISMTQYWENPQGERTAKTKTTKYVLILPQETIDELESLTTTGS